MVTALSSPSFYNQYVRLPSSSDPVPPEILNSPKRFPYFKDCLGAIDGTQINSSPSAQDRHAARNRKGGVTQNCLMGCTFDFKFSYVLSGWEGSASDALVYDDARRTDFRIPAGKYYLADAGYPSCDELLVPYRSTRYHLAEWGRADIR